MYVYEMGQQKRPEYTDVLPEKVPSPTIVERLHPVNRTFRRVDYRHTVRLSSGQ